MPVELRERTRRVATKIRSSTAVIVREGLTERVEWYEAKFQAEEERRRQEKEQAKKSKMQSLRPLGSLTAARLDNAVAASEPVEDPLRPLYIEYAQKLLPVIDLPLERRSLAQKAIAAIKKKSPLTHPLDGEILIALEREVLLLKATAPHEPAPEPLLAPTLATSTEPSPLERRLTRFIDDWVGRIVDPLRVRTSGDV